MKFYQKRGFALVVLILAIIGSGVYGISKKPAAPPEVSYYNWICDEAGLLDQETRQTIQDYNTAWNEQYYAVVAVAAVDDIRGWSSEDYARELGAKWGLGANDMLLLLVKGGDWYVACGDNLADLMTDTQQARLKTALDTPYYAGIIPRQRWISSASPTWSWPRPWAAAQALRPRTRTGPGRSLPVSPASASPVWCC